MEIVDDGRIQRILRKSEIILHELLKNRQTATTCLILIQIKELKLKYHIVELCIEF